MDANPFWNKLTKPLRDTVMDAVLREIPFEDSYTKDIDFNFLERLKVKSVLFKLFSPWVDKYFTGFENFSNQYVTNGNTEALSMLMANMHLNKIYTLPNEYNFYGYIAKTLGKEHVIINCIEDIANDGIVLLSVPGSRDGEIKSKQVVIDHCQTNDIPLFIDIAYCGLTKPSKIKIGKSSNTYVAFSFSKTVGLSFNRIGIMFTNKDVPTLDIMNKIGYVNLSGAKAAIKMMRGIPCDYVYNTYKDQYAAICKEKGLTKTNCILFGLDKNGDKFCTTEFYKTV